MSSPTSLRVRGGAMRSRRAVAISSSASAPSRLAHARRGSPIRPLAGGTSVYSELTALRYKTPVLRPAPSPDGGKEHVTDEQPHLRPASYPEEARQALE